MINFLFHAVQPWISEWITSSETHEFLVSVLHKLAAKTENELDDGLVMALAVALGVDLEEIKALEQEEGTNG